MHSNWFTLVLVFLFAQVYSQTNSNSQLGVPIRTHFSPEDYQGGIHSWEFDQSDKGLLYVANNTGLLEFDGNKWAKYDIPSSTKIRTVMVDSKGRIFVGGQNQIGYFVDTGTGLQFKSLLKELNDASINISEIWKIFEHDDKIFFNTEDKLIVLSSKGIRAIDSPGFLINSFLVNDRIFCQFYNEGVFEYKDGEFISLPQTTNLSRLVAVYPNGEGYYFFSESGGVFEYINSSIKLKVKLLQSDTVNDVILLQNGDYALGTQNNGLIILNSDFSRKLQLTKNKGISGRTVKSIYEDNFNNLWVAINNGIDYMKLSLPFTIINEELGVEGTGYDVHYFDNSIFLGTSNGLFTQNTASQSLENYAFNLIPESEGQVYNISQINNELFLNHNKGAFIIEEKKLKKIHDIGSWTFIKTSQPDLILGGDYKGIKYFKKKNNSWTYTKDITGLTESSRILVFENDTTLWMSHGYRGLYRLEFDENMQLKNEITHFDKQDGFPSNLLITGYNLNGKMVFASESGIFDFNIETSDFSQNQFFDQYLGQEHVSEFESGINNSIFYIQNQKFGVLEEQEYGEFQKKTSVFKHINKYISDDLQDISIVNNNRIFITAKDGFIQYDPTKEHIITEDFSTLIRSIKISKSDDSLLVGIPIEKKNLEINKNQSVRIEFASPYYDGFEDLKYSYRLKPLSAKWSKWSSMNEKSYDHLPYGDYTFEVKALNIYDIESQVSSYSFQVLTPWYASLTAIIMYTFAFVLALVLIPALQRRKHKTVTSMITEEKEKEIQIKDEEIDKLYNEKLQTELNLKNDQLTSITMQLVKNKEFIQNVQDKISKTLDKGGSTQELKRIINSIDNELSDEDYWDKFAYHFDQVHGKYLERLSSMNIKLSPREIKLAAFLRMNMSSKEIAKLLNITTRGVELARYRLRKKLKLEREQNLVEYLIELDKSNKI